MPKYAQFRLSYVENALDECKKEVKNAKNADQISEATWKFYNRIKKILEE